MRKARLIPIECGGGNDATGNLTRLSRQFQRDEPGRLIAFVGAFVYRDKHGTKHIVNSAWGNSTLDEQMMLIRKLERYLES